MRILQTSMHFYGWSSGLKTGMYYLRTQPPMYPISFALPPTPGPDTGRPASDTFADQNVTPSDIPGAGPRDNLPLPSVSIDVDHTTAPSDPVAAIADQDVEEFRLEPLIPSGTLPPSCTGCAG